MGLGPGALGGYIRDQSDNDLEIEVISSEWVVDSTTKI